MKTTKSDIERVLWKACDSFRGKIDSSRYKDYILSMLFVKYLSDVCAETKEKYMKQYDGDERRVKRVYLGFGSGILVSGFLCFPCRIF